MSTVWTAAFGVLALVTVLVAVVLLGLLRRAVGVLEETQQGGDGAGKGAPPGTVLTPFALVDERGIPVSSSDLIATGPTLFALFEEWCEPCHALASELSAQEVGRGLDGVELVAIVGRGMTRRALPLPPSMNVLYPADEHAVEVLRWRASPLALLVDERGLVIDRLVPNSLGHLQVLARRYGGHRRVAEPAVTGA